MRRAPFLIASFVVVTACFARAASPLADAPSAYVRAHAESPVRWMPWGEAAFARAKAEQKPVYVIIGAFTQELARAMREQSFAREENAALLNDNFICVVVDREERPDLAAFFQSYVATVKQMQGWPVNVWLTPELKPFEGATYLPPSDEWGKEGFPNAVRRIVNAWQTDADAQRAKADEAIAALGAAGHTGPSPVDAKAVAALLAENLSAWMGTYDAANGGFGESPRRLEPELLRFLLQQGDAAARDAALATLRAIVSSPVRDPIDGGFFRSSGDVAWQQPSFQKTLADQARMALTLHASGDAALGAAARPALAYALSLGSDERGFSAAEDGTAEAVLPSFFWTVTQLREALGASAPADVPEILGCSEAGNVPADAYMGIDSAGKNLPRLGVGAAPVADKLLARLRAVRSERPAPARDSAASSAAHGVLLAALAASEDASDRAAAAVLSSFIRNSLILPDGRLRALPTTSSTALARDYALVAAGLLAQADAAKDAAARRIATDLLARADALFWDDAAGRYLASEATLSQGVWVRVPAPGPEASEGFGAESAMLYVLSTHKLAPPARLAVLAAAVASDIRESPNFARGDQVLALQAFLAAQTQ